jgi:hypothetical protein
MWDTYEISRNCPKYVRNHQLGRKFTQSGHPDRRPQKVSTKRDENGRQGPFLYIFSAECFYQIPQKNSAKFGKQIVKCERWFR